VAILKERNIKGKCVIKNQNKLCSSVISFRAGNKSKMSLNILVTEDVFSLQDHSLAIGKMSFHKEVNRKVTSLAKRKDAFSKIIIRSVVMTKSLM
jgi:hypothetical protein